MINFGRNERGRLSIAGAIRRGKGTHWRCKRRRKRRRGREQRKRQSRIGFALRPRRWKGFHGRWRWYDPEAGRPGGVSGRRRVQGMFGDGERPLSTRIGMLSADFLPCCCTQLTMQQTAEMWCRGAWDALGMQNLAFSTIGNNLQHTPQFRTLFFC